MTQGPDTRNVVYMSTQREVIGTLTIDTPTAHTVHYETACNYDRYTLLPGTYNIVRTVTDYGRTDRLGVTVDAHHDERHLESRLFTASSLDTTTERDVATVSLGYYLTFGAREGEAIKYLERFGTVNI